MVHASCVQIAVIALKVSCATRATRKFPLEVCTSAALPTEASAEPSTFNEMAPPATVALMVGSEERLELGDVGEPPQLSSSDPIVTKVRALVQNSRRDELCDSMNAVVLQCVCSAERGHFSRKSKEGDKSNLPTVLG